MCAKRLGEATISLDNAPGVLASASCAGKKEGEGPLARYFDYIAPTPAAAKKAGKRPKAPCCGAALSSAAAARASPRRRSTASYPATF